MYSIQDSFMALPFIRCEINQSINAFLRIEHDLDIVVL